MTVENFKLLLFPLYTAPPSQAPLPLPSMETPSILPWDSGWSDLSSTSLSNWVPLCKLRLEGQGREPCQALGTAPWTSGTNSPNTWAGTGANTSTAKSTAASRSAGSSGPCGAVCSVPGLQPAWGSHRRALSQRENEILSHAHICGDSITLLSFWSSREAMAHAWGLP